MPVAQGQKRPNGTVPKGRPADVAAARLLIELREKRGLSRDQMPHAMLVAGTPRQRIPSVKTLWRMEELGHVPSVGVKFAVATFYGRDLHSIWRPHEPRCARSTR